MVRYVSLGMRRERIEQDPTYQMCSFYQPTNKRIISHKTHVKHFKTLRHVSILSDHRQRALFLAKVMLRCSQFNSYLQIYLL